MRSALFLYFIIIACNGIAQYKMRPIEDLINRENPGWLLVSSWIDSAKNFIEILPADSNNAKEALYQTQVTSRSPLGAIILTTGGILVDDGWIRILGSGGSKMKRSVPSWNKGKVFKDSIAEGVGYLLIADDAIGGFYLQNGGALGKDFGKIYYLSPDNLEFEAMDLTYTEFLLFCFNNDLEKYYQPYRWTGWRKDVKKLSPDRTFNFFPPLFTKQGQDINKASRKDVPIKEQFELTFEYRKQLGLQ